MAQAKKPKQEHEPGGPMSAEQFGEQARALNEQIVETATKIGQDALQHYVDWLQAVADEQRTQLGAVDLVIARGKSIDQIRQAPSA